MADVAASNEFYELHVDVEHSGSNLMHHDMVAFAAVLLRTRDGCVLEQFEGYPEPERSGGKILFEQRCYDEFWSKPANAANLAEFRRKMKPAQQEMHRFHMWVQESVLEKYGARDVSAQERAKQFAVLTDTAGSDFAWMGRYLGQYGLPGLDYIFGDYRPPRDSSSFLMGYAHRFPKDGMWGSEQLAAAKLGVNYAINFGVLANHDHQPLNDALGQAKVWNCFQRFIEADDSGTLIAAIGGQPVFVNSVWHAQQEEIGEGKEEAEDEPAQKKSRVE
jgi:hypothetical protein